MSPAAFVLVLVLGNIMANPTMPQADVRHDTAALFRLDGDATCGSEIGPDRYKRAFRAAAAAHGARAYGMTSPDPVALKARPRAVSVRLLTRGRPHLTPHRWAVVVRLTGAAVICTHLINRAWTSNDATTPLRRLLWHREMRGIRGIVRRLHDEGRTVFVGGDLNTPHRIRWAYPRALFLGNAYRMQAAVIPAAGWRCRRLASRAVPVSRLFTDHPMLWRAVGCSRVG